MTHKIRILHTESSIGYGGQELRIVSEALGFIERGHEVTIACSIDSCLSDAAARQGIPTVTLPMKRRNFAALRAVLRFLRDSRFDIINTHSSTDSWLFAIACKLTRHSAKLVRTRHIGADVAQDMATYWVYRHAVQRVVTTGEQTRRNLIENNGLPAGHVISVPTGIDLNHFVPGNTAAAKRKLGFDSERPLIGIVAIIRSGKGHRYLVEAANALRDKDYQYTIVGDGPGMERVSRQVESFGLQDRCRMPGHCDDVVPWIQAMDLFVLPSYDKEGVPQAIMQAMACGRAVISTPVGAIPEVIEDGINGVLVPPKNSVELARCIQQLMEDDALRGKLGKMASQRAQRRFGREKMLDQMHHVFFDVLGYQTDHALPKAA